jgi:hypothetical protein
MARSIWKKRFKNLTATTGNTRHHCCHHDCGQLYNITTRHHCRHHYYYHLHQPPPTTTNHHQPPPTTTIRADTTSTTSLSTSISFFFRCRCNHSVGTSPFVNFAANCTNWAATLKPRKWRRSTKVSPVAAGGTTRSASKNFSILCNTARTTWWRSPNVCDGI